MNQEAHNLLLQANLSCRGIGLQTEDETATLDMQQKYHTEEGAMRAIKKILVKPTAPIRSAVGRLRKTHLHLTFEGIGSSRILPVSENDTYQGEMAKGRAVVMTRVDEFAENYDTHLDNERIRLNGRFNISDYPRIEDVPDLFSVTYSLIPMPSPNQYLQTALAGHVQETLKVQYEAQLTAAVDNITATLLSDGLSLAMATAEILADPEKIIVDSENRKGKLTKLRDWADRINTANVQNNPQLRNLRDQVLEAISVSTENLREIPTLRIQTASQLKTVVSTFGQMGKRKVM